MTEADVIAGALKGTYGDEFPDVEDDDWQADAEFVLARFQEYGFALRAAAQADTAPGEGLAEAAEAYLDAEAAPAYSWVIESQAARDEGRPNREIERMDRIAQARAALRAALDAPSRDAGTAPGDGQVVLPEGMRGFESPAAALEALSADTAPGGGLPFHEALANAMKAESDSKLPTLRGNEDWLNYGSRVELALLSLGYASSDLRAALAAPSRDAATAPGGAVGGLITELTLAAAGGMSRVEVHPDLLRRAANTVAALAAPSRDAGLDAERLDRAMAAAGVHVDAARPGPTREVGCQSCAPGIEKIAAEYARLSPTDEPDGAP